MKIVINAAEINAANLIMDKAFMSRELDIPSHYIKEFIEGNRFMMKTRDTWVEDKGIRWFYSSTTDEITLEFNSNNVHIMHHVAANFDRYARVVNGVLAVGKAFKFALSAFKSEFKRLERFTQTLNDASKEYDYVVFDEAAFKAQLADKTAGELEVMKELYSTVLRDSDDKKEFQLVNDKLGLILVAIVEAEAKEETERKAVKAEAEANAAANQTQH